MGISRISTDAIQDNLDLSGKTITYGLSESDIPSFGGKVLQTVSTQDGIRRKYSSITHNTWLSDYSNINTTITPLSNDSKLYFYVDIHYGTDSNSGGSIFWQIRESGNIVPVLNGDTTQSHPCFGHRRWNFYTSDLQYHTERVGITGASIDNTVISARDFQIYFRVQNSGKDISINRDGSPNSDISQGSHSPTLTSRMTIVEVAN